MIISYSKMLPRIFNDFTKTRDCKNINNSVNTLNSVNMFVAETVNNSSNDICI